MESEERNYAMNDINFDYYRGVEAEQYSFYRIPKMLFTDAIFQDLSCEAKVLYGLMLDRMGLSLKNQWMDEIEQCRKFIKEQISYAAFEQNKFYRVELVDELVELMIEIFMMPDDSVVRIGGTKKSVAVIKSRFQKINQLHIEYVLDSMQKNQTNIGNIKAYLLTTLYNSTITMDSYYQAKVNYNLRENI